MSKEAEAHLREGDLAAALAALEAHVRAHPASPEHRVFLFQLLAVMGQWDRALRQLNVGADMDPGTLGMAMMYRPALRCELLRASVFEGRRTPLIFGEPASWVALILDALRLEAEGHPGEAAQTRAQALVEAPATSGTIRVAHDQGEDTEAAFTWIADADSRVGPMLPAILNGKYYWVPYSSIARIELEPPIDLRDLVWLPVHFRFANGGDAPALIPTRYPGSESHENDAIRLARRTEWLEPFAGTFHGLGQRILATDAGDFPLLQIRAIALDNPVPARAQADA